VAGSAAVARWQRQLGGSGGGATAAATATAAALPPRAAAVAMKTPAATVMAGAQTTINNQLKAAGAMATITATMEVMRTTIKT
jgi:hypothetical protein